MSFEQYNKLNVVTRTEDLYSLKIMYLNTQNMHFKNKNMNNFIYFSYFELALFVLAVPHVTILSIKLPVIRLYLQIVSE